MDAHKLTFEAETAFKASNLPLARAKYEESFQKWAAVLEAFPRFKDESTFVGDLKDVVDQYRKVLDQLDLKLPEDFVLKFLIEQPQATPAPADNPSKDVTGDPSQPETPKKKPTEGEDSAGP